MTRVLNADTILQLPQNVHKRITHLSFFLFLDYGEAEGGQVQGLEIWQNIECVRPTS